MSLLLLVAAVVCFLVALLIELTVFSGSNAAAWGYGGLLSLALSFLAGAFPAAWRSP